MNRITPNFILLLMSGCGRNLKEDIFLVVDDSNAQYYFTAGGEGSYLTPSESESVYNGLLSNLKSDFNEKGNDVTVSTTDGDFTLRITEISFGEYVTTETVPDPCDGAPLAYDVSVITGSMTCEVIDNTTGNSKNISASAESDEDVKDHPTFFQRVIGNDTCYTPRVSNAHPDAVKRRLVRRIHRFAMQAIRSMR